MKAATRGAIPRALYVVTVVAGSVLAATLVAFALEELFGLLDASPVYVVAVVVSAMLAGTLAGLGAAIVSVLLYDVLFTPPTLALHITDPADVLSLLLFSFVAVIVGQLVALQRRRTDEARRRQREAQGLYAVSHALATRSSTPDAVQAVASIIAERTGLERVWLATGQSVGHERIVADTGGGSVAPAASYAQLMRSADGAPNGWRAIHAPTAERVTGSDSVRLRVAITSGGTAAGSLWSERDRAAPDPDTSASRLMSAAADQVGLAWEQDRLAARAADARIAQASDELKTSLVESVSHDLRIPLAAIRAHAGPLMDPTLRPSPADVQDAATAIDRQAALLDRLVANLLDLGRIQGGMLTAHREAVELREAVQLAAGRLADTVGSAGWGLDVQVPESWVDADPLLLQQVVANVLENAVLHTPRGTRVLVTAEPRDSDGTIRLTIEDAGPGVTDATMTRVFERFYRGAARGSSGRPGSGLGLAVARGFVEAMSGRISARHSDLGGLAIDIRLPATVLPAELSGQR